VAPLPGSQRIGSLVTKCQVTFFGINSIAEPVLVNLHNICICIVACIIYKKTKKFIFFGFSFILDSFHLTATVYA